MELYKNKRILYLMVFFHNLIPAYVIERLFWQSRGMDVQMVVWTEFIYAGTIIALEIPSGVLADLLGRRKLVVLSAIFPCLEFIMLVYSTRFWHFAAVVLLAGIGKSMYSGAQNALLYESLSHSGRAAEFEKTVGRMNALDFSAGMIAALSGGFLAFRLGFEFNYWLSLCSSVIALVCALALREPPRECGQRSGGQALKAIALEAWHFFASKRDVLKIVLNASLIAAAAIYLDEFWQLYLDAISFPVMLFGVASAFLALMKIPGAVLAEKLLRIMGHTAAVLLCSVLFGIFVILSAAFPSIFGMAAIAAALGASAVIEPLALGFLHHRAKDDARATIESAMSLFERMLAIVIGLIFGYIASRSGVANGYMAIGLLTTACGCVFAITKETQPPERKTQQ